MIETLQKADESLLAWCGHIAQVSRGAKNLTIGLTSGNRNNNDARVIYRIMKSLQASVLQQSPTASLLLCRLNVESASALRFLGFGKELSQEPLTAKSALGNWFQVDVPIAIGSMAPRALQQVPRWLPKWKMRYDLVVVDLGPMHQVPSRVIGRFCDSNYVILGPDTTASAQWISQFIQYHEDCGAHIGGTIVATSAA